MSSTGSPLRFFYSFVYEVDFDGLWSICILPCLYFLSRCRSPTSIWSWLLVYKSTLRRWSDALIIPVSCAILSIYYEKCISFTLFFTRYFSLISYQSGTIINLWIIKGPFNLHQTSQSTFFSHVDQRTAWRIWTSKDWVELLDRNCGENLESAAGLQGGQRRFFFSKYSCEMCRRATEDYVPIWCLSQKGTFNLGV